MEVQIKERSETPEVSFDRYVGHTKRNLKLVRMWKFGNDSPKWKIALVTLNTAVLLTSTFLLSLFEFIEIRNASNLRDFASGLGDFWFHFLGFFKWFYFLCKVRRVMDLVGKLQGCYSLGLDTGDSDEGSPRLRHEMRLAKESSVRLGYAWSIFMTYAVVHWCINPVILQLSFNSMNITLPYNERPLPYITWIPWDRTESMGYWCAYLFQFLGGCASGVGHVSYDAFYMTLVMMVCAQFRYLNYTLTADEEEDHPNETSFGKRKKLTDSFLKERLQRSKIYHDTILRFLSSFEELINPVMFVECIGIVGSLCLVSFEATTTKLKGDIQNTMRVWSMLDYIMGAFTQLFVICYYADKATTLGLKVADSAYSCGWESSLSQEKSSEGYAARRNERKAIEFLIRDIITRAQKPVQLTGGPFYVLSLETYRGVVSAAFSYMAVLRELSNK